MNETLYDVMNRIALEEYGTEIWRIEDEDIWLYVLEKAERQARTSPEPAQGRETYGKEKPKQRI